MKVVVAQSFQVADAGVVYRPGHVADVPDHGAALDTVSLEVEPLAREYIALSTGTPIDQVAINWRRCTL